MKFKSYDQNQGVFATITPNDLLEPDHPARIIDLIVEKLDLSEIYSCYTEEGKPAYHPKMMLKVLFYGYYRGLMSCRKMWDGLKVQADFIFLSGYQLPDFRTINDFRKKHIKELPKIFTQIVFLCKSLGMIGFKNLLIDGELIQANASFRKSKNKDRLARSLSRVENGIKKLLEKEINEDFSEQKKQKRINVLKQQETKLNNFNKLLSELGEKKSKDVTVNMTDNEAKIMTHKDGRKLPSYNHQSAIDGELGVCVGIKTSDAPDKSADLIELVEITKENTGESYKNVSADSKFCDYELLEEVEEKREEEFYVPDMRFEVTERKKTKRGKYDKSNFSLREDGLLICPNGYEMELKQTLKNEDGHSVNIFEGIKCSECKNREECTKGQKRKVAIDSREKYRTKMREKLRSDKGREIYIRRQFVETIHGNDQKNKGWKQHHLRGKIKAHLEVTLRRIVDNIGKIIMYRSEKILEMA